MNKDTQNRVIKVVLPKDLAARALDAAHAGDVSRSAWIRGLITTAIDQTETE